VLACRWGAAGEQDTLAPGRRGNCWNNAVVSGVFNLLKRERIRREKHKTREEARRCVCALRRWKAIV